MLTGIYIALRFVHFLSLMVAFGCVLYGAWWAPLTLRRLLMQRFFPLLRHLLLLSAVSALLMLMVQGGLMGNGWADLWQPAIWQAVAGTRFGSVWVWQILLAWIALAIAWLKPRRPARLLLVRVDISHALAVRQAQARSDLLQQLLLTLLSVSLFGLLLHLLWFRRADQLRHTAVQLGRGDLSARAGLRGADELALIGRAVDLMASDLQQRQTELQQLADRISHSPVVVMTWRNAEGWPARYVSDSIALWGYRRQDLLSGRLRYADLMHPEDLPRIAGEVARHLAQGQDEYRQEYRIRHGDGRWMWIEDRTWLVRDAAGQVVDIHGVLIDVSELHAARAELAIQVRRLHEAEAHARLGSWTYDVGQGRGWWSAQMYALFNADPSAGVPSFEDFIARVHEADQPAVRMMLQSFAQGVTPDRNVEVFRRHPDLGPARWFSVTI